MATILTKKSDTASAVPLAADLTNAAGGAELAVNATDKRLFSKTSGGTVVELGINPSSLTMPNGTANGVAYLNGSKVVTSGSALTFDGSNLATSLSGATSLQMTSSGSQAFINLRSVAGGGFEPFIGFGDTSAGNIGQMIGVSGGGLRWTTGGSEQMRLTSTGLGIGTSSPSVRLSVATGASTFAATFQGSSSTNFVAIGTTGFGASINGYTAGFASAADLVLQPNGGNLGLGVTPSAWSSQAKAIQLGAYAGFYQNASGLTAASFNSFQNTSNIDTYRVSSNGAGKYEIGGGHAWYVAPSGTAGNAITFSQAMTLDSSGNLLVGTTSAGAGLGYATRLAVDGGASEASVFKTSAGTSAYCSRMWNSATSGNNVFVNFQTEASGTDRGSISYNRVAGLTAYNTTSDYRAKDISGPITNSGALIDSTPVYMGKMKGATQERPMFIAHEVPAYAHTGEKDAVDADGNPVYQQMDASALIPVMWAEIQSLRKRLADAGI